MKRHRKGLSGTLFGVFLFLSGAVVASGQDAAHAEVIVPDGSFYTGGIALFPAPSNAWFTFPIYHSHSYAIEVYSNTAALMRSDSALAFSVFESDGTTSVPVNFCNACEPSMQDDASIGGGSLVGGERAFLASPGSITSRFITVAVGKLGGGTPSSSVGLAIRVVDTTLAAARWTVNGYRALFALNNLSNGSHAKGSIQYWGENGNFLDFDSFDIPPNGGTQISRPASVPIGGQLFGVVRIVFGEGSAQQVIAREYNFAPAANQFIFFDFKPVFQAGLGQAP